MAGAFTVPNEAESELMMLLGLDPKEYAVVVSNEDTLWLMHYKTRHEITIRKNGREQT